MCPASSAPSISVHPARAAAAARLRRVVGPVGTAERLVRGAAPDLGHRLLEQVAQDHALVVGGRERREAAWQHHAVGGHVSPTPPPPTTGPPPPPVHPGH